MAASVTTLAGRFGRLWRPGHESFGEARRILRVQGTGATTYLQGLVTSDLLAAPVPPREETEDDELPSDSTPGVEFSEKLRSMCFLDNKGRILTDSLLWKRDETEYYVDVPSDTADQLMGHLKQFILRRSKVKVKDVSDEMTSSVVFGTLNAQGTPPGYMAGVDPRHPSLGMRILSLPTEGEGVPLLERLSANFPNSPGNYRVVRHLAGVAEGSELTGKVAGETNQDFLNAVSFRKGCYLGQELTARVQFTGAIRKRVMPIFLTDWNMEIPRPWLLASQLQHQQQIQQEAGESTGENENISDLAGPRLPRLSPSAAATWVGIMSGRGVEGQPETPASSEVAAQSEALLEGLQALEVGSKIVDKGDGKTIGQIVAKPEPGTNVALAQMRLDRVGLLGNGVWSHTNKVTIGDHELRYLPYLPLWWPEIDRETGKALEVDN